MNCSNKQSHLVKKAHHETDIANNTISVSYGAVELAKKMFGKMNKKQALVIGAGEMAELAVLNLKVLACVTLQSLTVHYHAHKH